METNKRLTLVVLFALFAALLLVACGGVATTEEGAAGEREEVEADHHDEGAGDGHQHEADVEKHEEDHTHELTTHDPIDGAEEIRVVALEWGFEPSAIHLHEGEAVNIVLVNEGTLEHEVELDAFDFHVHAEAGETVTAGFVPDQTGDFEFACFIPGHYDAGMVGELLVEHAH